MVDNTCGGARAAGRPSFEGAPIRAARDRRRRRPTSIRAAPGRRRRAPSSLLWMILLAADGDASSGSPPRPPHPAMPCDERDEGLCETDSTGKIDRACAWHDGECESFFRSEPPWEGDRGGLATLPLIGIRDFSPTSPPSHSSLRRPTDAPTHEPSRWSSYGPTEMPADRVRTLFMLIMGASHDERTHLTDTITAYRTPAVH